MRYLLAVALLTAFAARAEPGANYAPLSFLAGYCWMGTFPDGKQTDEHCFAWVYGGKFLRDQHTVRGNDRPDYLGESIYFWNSAAKQVEYLYIENDGGFSRGVVSAAANALVFPPTSYVEDGKTRTYRSRWQRVGDDAYDVVTEFQSGAAWVEGFKVRMVRRAGG